MWLLYIYIYIYFFVAFLFFFFKKKKKICRGGSAGSFGLHGGGRPPPFWTRGWLTRPVLGVVETTSIWAEGGSATPKSQNIYLFILPSATPKTGIERWLATPCGPKCMVAQPLLYIFLKKASKIK
jgi:hypothetical protein